MPMYFGTGKSRDVLCRSCRMPNGATARHDERDRRDTLDATSATRTTRVQGRRHSVDWGGHAHLTFSRSVPEIDAYSEHKKTILCPRALLLLRRPSF